MQTRLRPRPRMASPACRASRGGVIIAGSRIQAAGCVFYVNGIATDTLNSSNLTAGAGPFEIGHNHWNQWCIGMIDEVRVYDRVLSAEEVAALAGHTNPLPKAF